MVRSEWKLGVVCQGAGRLLARTIAVSALVGAGQFNMQAAAGPALRAEPVGVLAANNQTSPEGAKDLLRTANSRAVDLQVVPPLWDWSAPTTINRLGQAPPAQEPAAQTPPPEPTAQPAPPAATQPPGEAPPPAQQGESGDILDEVSVTATRRPTRERDTTATTYVVKKEDFQAQGATTATDALLLVPGFVGNPSLGGQRNAGQNFLRGFDDQRFLVLRDGLSLTFPQNGRSGISQVPVDDLERIEVVTGGATLRYGAGSVGGAINLITETPKGPPKLTLQYEVGSYGFSRYIGKYGGGDDTLSYNLVYTGLVAFNDYPFSFNLPNTAQYYGPTSNPDSTPSQNSLDAGAIDPSSYENGENSFGIGGAEAADPQNNGPIDLYGYLKPDIGPPITVKGTNDSSYTASDSYTAKLSAKPDALNRLTLRLNHRNNKFDDQGPGTFNLAACLPGVTSAADGNGTTNGDRFFPLDSNGNEVACNVQRFLVGTPTSQAQYPFPLNFNTSADGSIVFPTGQSYPNAEVAQANIFLFNRRFTSQTETSLNWDYDLTPTTSVNSYVRYYRNVFNTFRPTPYLTNTNLFGTGFDVRSSAQPYSDGNKFETQTALNTQLSPGQALAFGVNFVQDRVYQQQNRANTFIDRAIARTSAFLTDDISFSDQLKANLGFRYTYSTQFGVVGTPGVGIRFSPNSLISFRANYSYVYNAPNIADLYVSSGTFVDNPNIQPETGVTYDAGIDITPARNLGFRATYFSTYLDGTFGTRIFPNPDVNNDTSANFGAPLLQQSINLNSRVASGIEFTGDWQITEQVRFRTIWTNTDARNIGPVDSITNTVGLFNFQYQDASIPFNNVVTTLTYANQGITATLLGRYDGGKRRFSSNAFVPAWATLDLNVEIPITRNFTLTGNVFNITDSQYEYLDGVPAPGTSFRVGGRLEFGGAEPEAQ